ESAAGAVGERGAATPLVSEGDRLLAKAQALAKEGQSDAAVDLIQQVLKEGPAELSARLALGQIYDRRGDYLEALEQYEAARALDPDNVVVLSKIGVVLAALGRFDEAERELKRAQRLDPNRADVHATIGILHFKRGLYAAAEAELKRAIELEPDHATAYFYRGESLNQLD